MKGPNDIAFHTIPSFDIKCPVFLPQKETKGWVRNVQQFRLFRGLSQMLILSFPRNQNNALYIILAIGEEQFCLVSLPL